MSSKFIDVARQAFATYDGSKLGFEKNFKTLKDLADKLSCKDLGVEMDSHVKELAKLEHKPFIYVPIFDKSDAVSMVVFILRGDATIPLHDHPMRHGLLRCIYGKLRVRSFTLKPASKNYDAYEVQVTAEPVHQLNTSSECMVLAPDKGNIHDITAVDGVAAFYEILSPSFTVDDPEKGMRSTKFYVELASKSMDEVNVRLKFTPWPTSFAIKHVDMPQKIKKCQAKLVQLAKKI